MHLLVSSHLLRDVEECCDEVLILKNGVLSARCNLAEERRAQRKFLELETTGGTGFPEAAARLGCECASFGNGRLKLVLPDRLTIQQLYAAAAEQGVQIRRFSYRRDSLEDIFLRAMETPETREARRAAGRAAVMAVHKRLYRPLAQAELTPRWSRFLVLPRFAAQGWRGSRLLTAFLVLCAAAVAGGRGA